MSDTIIRFKNVSKEYRLGVISSGTLRGDLQSWFARVSHKEDPNSLIGTSQNKLGQRFLALDNLSLDINKGEAIGIVGRNGAGKSTLLKVLARVTAPTKGTVTLNGRIVSMLEVGTGFHPELTGRENIFLNGAILGMNKCEIKRKIDEIIYFSEISDFIDTPVKRYSSGMYVKLAFSVAAHLESEIMIMDEVLAVGDAKFQEKCLRKMRDVVNEEGKTVLYVSHNMMTVRKLCTRCIMLDKGHLVMDGATESVISYYLGSSMSQDLSRDLSEVPRPYKTSQKAKMCYIEAVGKDSLVYDMGEPIVLKLKWESEQDYDNMVIRCGVWSSDGSAAGVTFSESFHGAKGKQNETLLQLDTAYLCPGKYRLEFILNEVNEFGAFTKHDVIQQMIGFEITPSPDEPVFSNWNSSWGYAAYPKMRVLN